MKSLMVMQMTEKYYEVWFYQENGFASTHCRVKSFKSEEKAKKYAEQMNQQDSDAIYDVYKREFDD